jgi:hypothetical protein
LRLNISLLYVEYNAIRKYLIIKAIVKEKSLAEHQAFSSGGWEEA